MQLELSISIAVFTAVAAFFSLLAYLRSRRSQPPMQLSPDQLAPLLRVEMDRMRQATDNNARDLRTELASNLSQFQQTNLRFFGELRNGIEQRVTNFCEVVEKNIDAADNRAAATAARVDQGLSEIMQETASNRDVLRRAVDAKLDEASEKQMATAKNLREEIVGNFGKLGDVLRSDLNQFSDRLDKSVKAIDERAMQIGSKLDQDLARVGEEAHKNRDALKMTID